MRSRPAPSHPAPRPQPEPPQTTAPHDELVSVVRGLVEASPKRAVSIDSVANALKSRGFQRSPGSPRLVTRLRRIREILVSQSGMITLAEDAGPPGSPPRLEAAPPVESEPVRVEDESPVASEPVDEPDDDRQPDFLNYSDSESDEPEVDGNRAEPPRPQSQPGRSGSGGGSPSGSGRRRRRRRWRGGPASQLPARSRLNPVVSPDLTRALAGPQDRRAPVRSLGTVVPAWPCGCSLPGDRRS